MKLLLLTVCCVIATSLAGPFSDKEEKLETALSDIEAVLQNLSENKATDLDDKYLGDFPRPNSHSRDLEEILLYSENIARTTAEVKAMGGRVPIQMGHNLLIAKVPSDVATKQDAFLYASPQVPPTAPKATLNNAKAYEMYRENKLRPQPKIQKWTEKSAPKFLPPRPSPLPADSPYTQTMRGRIAVGVIVVSGPGSLAVSTDEQQNILSQIFTGLSLWYYNAPYDADLTFVVYSGLATISASDGPVGCSYEQCHDVFAVPGLKALGFSSKENVAQSIKDDAGAAGGYIAFFSKYRQAHFAYTYQGSGPIYMQYSNGDRGSDQIYEVFARETGHVFNAPYEYTSCCDCDENYGKGTCTSKNGNCNHCTTHQEDCIMNSNAGTICAYTRKHVGWC